VTDGPGLFAVPISAPAVSSKSDPLQNFETDVRSLLAEHHLLTNPRAPNLSISRFSGEFSETVRKMIEAA
jgi:hypothetical protein